VRHAEPVGTGDDGQPGRGGVVELVVDGHDAPAGGGQQ
jgi:hypothetical protein